MVVQEAHAREVVDAPVDIDLIIEGGPVLRHVHGDAAIGSGETDQQVVETAGYDLPVHGCAWVVAGDELGMGGGPRDIPRLIVIHAQEVDRRADDREVAGLDVTETDALPLVRRHDVGGIGAAEDGVQIGAVDEAVLRPGGGAVILPLRHRVDGDQVQGDTDRAASQVQGVEGLRRQAMPEQ